MIRAIVALLLLTAPAIAADPRCDGPGRYDAMRDGVDCFSRPYHGRRIQPQRVETDRGTGLAVCWYGEVIVNGEAWCEIPPGAGVIALPPDEDAARTERMREQLRAIDARDHGAHPYSGRGH